MAALALIAERKELLSKILVTTEVNGAGVYMLRLFKDGVWKPVIVDSLLPCNSLHKLVFSSVRPTILNDSYGVVGPEMVMN